MLVHKPLDLRLIDYIFEISILIETNIIRTHVVSYMVDIESATEEALNKARRVYQNNKNIDSSLGFAKIQGLDGRKKEARYFKKRDEFSVSSNSSTHIAAPNGTTVKILEFGSQSIERKRVAHEAFIEVMKDHGFFEDQDVSVYTRMD